MIDLWYPIQGTKLPCFPVTLLSCFYPIYWYHSHTPFTLRVEEGRVRIQSAPSSHSRACVDGISITWICSWCEFPNLPERVHVGLILRIQNRERLSILKPRNIHVCLLKRVFAWKYCKSVLLVESATTSNFFWIDLIYVELETRPKILKVDIKQICRKEVSYYHFFLLQLMTFDYCSAQLGMKIWNHFCCQRQKKSRKHWTWKFESCSKCRVQWLEESHFLFIVTLWTVWDKNRKRHEAVCEWDQSLPVHSPYVDSRTINSRKR